MLKYASLYCFLYAKKTAACEGSHLTIKNSTKDEYGALVE